MDITEVKIHLRNEEKLKAYATITFDNCFVIRDLKIIQGNTGMFVAMPSRKKPDGTFKDIAHPLNNDTRKMIETKILEAYKTELLNLKDQVTKIDEATLNRKKTDDLNKETTSTTDYNKTMSDLEKNLENKFNSI